MHGRAQVHAVFCSLDTHEDGNPVILSNQRLGDESQRREQVSIEGAVA